jgi:hypothetical protein
MRVRFVGLLLTGLACTGALLGCSGSAPGPALAEPHPVQGKITFTDNTALKGGIIFFSPTEIKDHGQMRYETAGLIDAQGRYRAGFNADDRGAPAGECKVTIKPRDYQELPGSNSNRIPARYREQSTTPLTVTVKEGNNTFDFVLK